MKKIIKSLIYLKDSPQFPRFWKKELLPRKLVAAEKKLGFKLPKNFGDLYKSCNGMVVYKEDQPCFRILCLKEIVNLFECLRHFLSKPFTVIPFTDTFNSDPYALCCNGPLKGRVFHIIHDGDFYPAFRTLGKFLRHVRSIFFYGCEIEILREWYDYDLSNPARTKEDDAAGMAILRLAKSSKAPVDYRNYWFEWAARMLGPERTSELGFILDIADRNRRAVALTRLTHIESPSSEAILRKFEEHRTAFLSRCRKKLARAGYTLSDEIEDFFELKNGSRIDLMFDFPRRNNPSVFEQLIKSIKEWEED